jgi:hypothetical protein
VKKVNGSGGDFKVIPKDPNSLNVNAIRSMSDFLCKLK